MVIYGAYTVLANPSEMILKRSMIMYLKRSIDHAPKTNMIMRPKRSTSCMVVRDNSWADAFPTAVYLFDTPFSKLHKVLPAQNSALSHNRSLGQILTQTFLTSLS